MPPIESQAQDFVIEILEGRDTGTKITLSGRALPYRGVSWEGSQRIKTTYYPGNPVASQQVMGPIESNTIITGIWKDHFLGNGVGRQLADTFDGVMRSGVMVRVTWGQSLNMADGTPSSTSGAIVREGLIKRFKPSYDRPQDVAFEVEFEWRGRAEPAAAPFTHLVNEKDGVTQVLADLQVAQASNKSFADSVSALLFGLTSPVEIALNTAATDIEHAINQFVQISYAVRALEDFPAGVAEQINTQAAGAAQALRGLNGILPKIPKNQQLARDEALSYLTYIKNLIDTTALNDAAQETLHNTITAMKARRQPEVIAQERPIPGTDLRDLALKYYQDPDLWWIIADYNGLTSSIVPSHYASLSDDPGNPIQIPRRSSGLSSSTRQSY